MLWSKSTYDNVSVFEACSFDLTRSATKICKICLWFYKHDSNVERSGEAIPLKLTGVFVNKPTNSREQAVLPNPLMHQF